MAYKDSGEIANNSNYALGDYSFRIERTSVPGSTNDKIEAICTQGGKNARKSIQIPSDTKLNGWYVEANETEATVYAEVDVPISGSDEKKSDLIPIALPVASPPFTLKSAYYLPDGIWTVNGGGAGIGYTYSQGAVLSGVAVLASDSPFTVSEDFSWRGTTRHDETYVDSYYTHNNKTVYSWEISAGVTEVTPDSGLGNILKNYRSYEIAWTLIYGDDAGEKEYKTETMLVGRFAIDIEDAGGDGPGSDWTDPGDYDPDWEEGDPTHTLYVEVIGALSGRHNDPIEDPSYSYIPSDKDTVKDYGCGGDGGHGGGGGAGASTVVVHKFATNQANSKEVTAIARRHGYGSGGGKGGKGGDGCILVYY